MPKTSVYLQRGYTEVLGIDGRHLANVVSKEWEMDHSSPQIRPILSDNLFILLFRLCLSFMGPKADQNKLDP
jgi:hypothetical protein